MFIIILIIGIFITSVISFSTFSNQYVDAGSTKKVHFTQTITSSQDPGLGHENHQLAVILSPNEGTIYDGSMTFTSSDLVKVVVLHEINQNDVQGQDTWTVNENTIYGLSLIDPQKKSGSFEFTGAGLGLHSTNSKEFTTTVSVDGWIRGQPTQVIAQKLELEKQAEEEALKNEIIKLESKELTKEEEVNLMLLKAKRNKLPRPEKATYPAVIIAITGIILALIGNIILNPEYLGIFLEYLIPTILVVGFMLYRTPILKGLLLFLDYITPSDKHFFSTTKRKINIAIRSINAQEFVFFTKGDNVAGINEVLQYILANEDTRRLKIVNVLKKDENITIGLKNDIQVLDRAYPNIVIELVEEPGVFGPEKIHELSERWKIPVNFMFIGSPGDKFPYRIQEFGGVRLII